MDNDIKLFSLNNYVRPNVVETQNKDWVLNGKNNYFYQYIIDRYNGSVTNSSVINSYNTLTYGQGLSVENNPSEIDKLAEILKPEEIEKIISDFNIFNEAKIQVIKNKGKGLFEISHIANQKVVPNIKNAKGEIEGYWFSDDWSSSKNKPEFIPAFGNNKSREIYHIKPYSAGKDYFPDPLYLAALQYCEMEEEIANLNINSIKNGLSAGYIINVPNGNSLEEEEKLEFERQIKVKLTGSPNASRFVLSFNGIDAEITITPFPVNENIHKQWQFLTQEARQQILTGHRVTSPSIVGVISSTGFSNTAEEMDMAESQLMKRVIKPKQNKITNAFEVILSEYDINLDLLFLPLTEEKEEEEEKEEIEPTKTELSFNPNQKRDKNGRWTNGAEGVDDCKKERWSEFRINESIDAHIPNHVLKEEGDIEVSGSHYYALSVMGSRIKIRLSDHLPNLNNVFNNLGENIYSDFTDYYYNFSPSKTGGQAENLTEVVNFMDSSYDSENKTSIFTHDDYDSSGRTRDGIIQHISRSIWDNQRTSGVSEYNTKVGCGDVRKNRIKKIERLEKALDFQFTKHICLEDIITKYALDHPEGFELSNEDDYNARLSANQTSEQDSKIWKIRYKYVKGTSKTPEGDSRAFCNRMLLLAAKGKVFRKEDIELMSEQGVNGDFAHEDGKYDIFLYAGGVNCYHRWERRIFKKKLNKDGTPKKGGALATTTEVNVNEAKRQGAKIPKNNPDVAIAEIDKPNKGSLKFFKEKIKLMFNTKQ
jgi:hypothetical protein